MKKRIIIPARYSSSRLPTKLLIEIAGKPVLQHTYEKALACKFDSVLIATDHADIAALCQKIGAEYCMTSETHPSGTDRCAEAMQMMSYSEQDIILNLQGDEPLMAMENLLHVTRNLADNPSCVAATLCEPLFEKKDVFNPHYVKVVFDQHHHALYFSRAPIPWARDDFPAQMPAEQFCYYRHIGLYAYRGKFLNQYPALCEAPFEQLESLEQLRVLYHGFKMHVGTAPVHSPPGIDTAASLLAARQILENLPPVYSK